MPRSQHLPAAAEARIPVSARNSNHRWYRSGIASTNASSSPKVGIPSRWAVDVRRRLRLRTVVTERT